MPLYIDRVILDSAATGANDAVRKQEFDAELTALSSGYARRKAVKNIVDNTAAPPTEVTGDRYVLDFTGGGVNLAWDGASAGDIVEYNGTTWEATTPAEGWIVYIDDQNKDGLFVDDGAPAWEVRDTAVTDHTALANIGVNTHAQIDTHIADTNNPHGVDKNDVGLGNVENTKNNSTTVAPSINDDISLGYTVGSRWIDTATGKEYVCTDNTDGAAVWIETTQGSGTDINVRVSANDTTPGDIEAKVVGTTGKIILTTLNDGGDEQIKINIGGDVFDKTVDDTDDITEGAVNKFVGASDLAQLQSIKAGKEVAASFTGNPRVVDVVFSSAYADSNYAVILVPVTSNDTDKYIANVSNKTATGFRISLGTGSTTNLVEVMWIAIKFGE